MKKEVIIQEIISHLMSELAALTSAAQNAHLAAIDEQSIAETQYDTLAIEASYLAQGQSLRAEEIQHAILLLQQMPLIGFNENKAVAQSALVQLEKDANDKHWFFILPAAGGFKGNIAGQRYTVITPHSPMAQALTGKFVDDEIEIHIGDRKIKDFISVIA